MSEHVSLYEAKTKLSHWIDEVATGKEILICKYNKPVAVLAAYHEPGRGKRRIGLAKDSFSVPATFFEPLPPELEDLFEGRGS